MARMLVLAALCALQLQCCSSCGWNATVQSCISDLSGCIGGYGLCTRTGHTGMETDCQCRQPAETLAISFHDCADSSTDADVEDVAPGFIAVGSPMALIPSGTLKKDYTGGNYTMTMWSTPWSEPEQVVKNCNGDASQANTCDIVDPLLGKIGSLGYWPVSFPIKPGVIHYPPRSEADMWSFPKVALTLNEGLPASLKATTTALKVTSSNGDKIMCVQIMTKAAPNPIVV